MIDACFRTQPAGGLYGVENKLEPEPLPLLTGNVHESKQARRTCIVGHMVQGAG